MPKEKCKTSPHCSHNTNGRDLDKPCSIEFPTHSLNKKVKPEGVGEWGESIKGLIDDIRMRFDLTYSAGVRGDGEYLTTAKNRTEITIQRLLLQEKAKWTKESHDTQEGWCCACGYDLAKLSELIQIARDDFENRLEEYRNSPDVWKHVGISKWRNWGEKCGYFDYLSGK